MNVHPIFVHFPIALLTLYAFLELAHIRLVTRLRTLQHAKIFLLFAGTLAAIPTLIAGKLAQWDLAYPAGSHTAHVITIHSYFALSTFIVFSMLSIAYACRLYLDLHPTNSLTPSMGKLIRICANVTAITPVIMLFAFIGVLLIFITGTLGGTIVYGPDLDPITHFVNTLLFGS